LIEVEIILRRKHHASQSMMMSPTTGSPKTSKEAEWTEINFVNDKILHKIEQIGNQLLPSGEASDEAECSNIMVQYNVLKLLDQILKCKLIAIESKATSSLVYLVNHVFLLHDVFVGTPLAQRMVNRCKHLLNYIAKRSNHTVSILLIFRGLE
jgi:hypothetical protein